ncbi:MAG: glycoside hydrolase family 3 N-terminal domain-containing protein, partial [Candidatus Eiseniibacteriota bacterium]
MDAQRAIARRMVIGLPREGLSPAWEKDFSSYPPAGLIVFARDFATLLDLRCLTARLRALARPRRIFIAIDEEGGFVSQLGGHLVVPPNAALLARGGAPGDVEWAARVTGERLRALGVDWVFAPVADIHSEPRNPVIGPRAFGADPSAVAGAVAGAMRGYRAAGVAACLKHFPGHGDTVLDSHLALPRCDADASLLEARELHPFRANRDADAVMTAHVVYPALDAGRPATFSRAIVHDLLRERLGFQGVTITDALEMKGASEGRPAAESARLALEAGCDLLLFAFHDEAVRRARLELARMLVDGAIDRAAFDEARPRLAAFDRDHPEPGAEELGRPLDALTPPDWESRLEGIAERGLIAKGTPPPAAAGPWRVSEPAFPSGRSLADDLAAHGIPIAAGDTPALEVVATMSRTALPAAELERLRALCRERPTVLVGLQNDAFLDDLPEAALRLSAADATPLTRRVVARTLAEQR